jgi:hypothetical protein
MTTTLTLFLFLCGLAGFILNRNNVILLIVAIELLLLAVIIRIYFYLSIPALPQGRAAHPLFLGGKDKCYALREKFNVKTKNIDSLNL